MADGRSFLIFYFSNYNLTSKFAIFKYGRQGAIFKYNLTLKFTISQYGCHSTLSRYIIIIGRFEPLF